LGAKSEEKWSWERLYIADLKNAKHRKDRKRKNTKKYEEKT